MPPHTRVCACGAYVRAVRTYSLIHLLSQGQQQMLSPHLQFGLLTEVTELNLGRNEFTRTMPSEIGCMTKLVTGGGWGLVASNQLTGTLPTELGNLDQMTQWMV